jgi:hypothetical protein
LSDANAGSSGISQNLGRHDLLINTDPRWGWKPEPRYGRIAQMQFRRKKRRR